MTMSNERFNQLLNGTLHHPLMPLNITRLSLALWFVLEQTGDAGEKALERWCHDRQQQDDRNHAE